MKSLITFATFLTFTFLGYLIDNWLYNLIIKQVPNTEWLGVIKIAVVIVLFLLTAGFILGFSALFAQIISTVMNVKSKSNREQERLKKKSVFAQRLEDRMNDKRRAYTINKK